MDAFETSLGYRSLAPALSPPRERARERLSLAKVLRYALDLFDAHLAEALRSDGSWHWKLEICEIAEQVAETLCFGEQNRSERLRSALLEYYEGRYRKPSAKEYLTFLRGKKVEKAASPVSPFFPAQSCPYHAGREGIHECPRCLRLYCAECHRRAVLAYRPQNLGRDSDDVRPVPL